MSRRIGVGLENPNPVYRAVILKLYPGIHTKELKRYTTGDGTEFLYHESHAYGPYETKAPATAQITSALKSHENAIKHGYYTYRNVWDEALRKSVRVQEGTVPEFTAFVEEQLPSWNQMPATVRRG